MAIKKSALSFLNATISKAQSSQHTYKATKLNYLSKSGGQLLSKDLFQKGLKLNLIGNGQSVPAAKTISDSVRDDLTLDIRKIKKIRKNLVNPQANKITKFVRINGRIIPIRAKK